MTCRSTLLQIMNHLSASGGRPNLCLRHPWSLDRGPKKSVPSLVNRIQENNTKQFFARVINKRVGYILKCITCSRDLSRACRQAARFSARNVLCSAGDKSVSSSSLKRPYIKIKHIIVKLRQLHKWRNGHDPHGSVVVAWTITKPYQATYYSMTRRTGQNFFVIYTLFHKHTIKAFITLIHHVYLILYLY